MSKGEPGLKAASLVARVEKGWEELRESYWGLSAEQMTRTGVAGEWSVKDMLGHVSTWEEEALRHLPTVADGGRPPRYKDVGGIDAFNARAVAGKMAWSVTRVLEEMETIHARLLEYVLEQGDIEEPLRARFVKRLRLDAYGHYGLHAEMIAAWRTMSGL